MKTLFKTIGLCLLAFLADIGGAQALGSGTTELHANLPYKTGVSADEATELVASGEWNCTGGDCWKTPGGVPESNPPTTCNVSYEVYEDSNGDLRQKATCTRK